jgi:hypothetical protein
MRAGPVFERAHPEGRLCLTRGNLLNLPSGNAIVGWVGEPSFSESGDHCGPHGGCGIV